MKPTHQIEYRKLSEMKELPGNPRTIKKEQFEKLKKSIQDNQDYFEARPLILSDRTGELVILAGNQRYKAAKALGMESVPTVLLDGLTEEREREIIIRDNVNNGEWDMDTLANEWDVDDLAEWGLEEIKWGFLEDFDEIVEAASKETVKEYSDDTDYDLSRLYREKVNGKIVNDIEKARGKGKIRDEIYDILKTRATQCSIFNFDEIIKFYRSGDASDEEKELLRRLYLVFITPKEAFESGSLEIDRVTGEIYDHSLTQKELEQ